MGQPSLFDSVNSNKSELGQTRPAWFVQQGQHGLVQHGLAHLCSVNVVLRKIVRKIIVIMMITIV